MKRMKKSLKVLVVVLVLMLAFQSVAMGADASVTGYVLEFDGGHHYFDLAKLVTSYLAYVDNGSADPAALMFKTYYEMRVPTDTTKIPATPVGYTIAGVSEVVAAETIIDLYKDFKTTDSTTAMTQIVAVLSQLNDLMNNTDPTNVLAQKVINTVKPVTAGDDGTPITISIIGEDGKSEGVFTIDEDGKVTSDNDPIAEVAIEKAALAPVKDKAVPTAITSIAGVNISVKWTDTAKDDAPITGTFKLGQAPKANLTITPVFGYAFDEEVAITYGGEILDATPAGGAYTASVKFDELKDTPPLPTKVAIKSIAIDQQNTASIAVEFESAVEGVTFADFAVTVNEEPFIGVAAPVSPEVLGDDEFTYDSTTGKITLGTALVVGDEIVVSAVATSEKISGKAEATFEIDEPGYAILRGPVGDTISMAYVLCDDNGERITDKTFYLIIFKDGEWQGVGTSANGLVDISVGSSNYPGGVKFWIAFEEDARSMLSSIMATDQVWFNVNEYENFGNGDIDFNKLDDISDLSGQFFSGTIGTYTE